MKKIGITLIIIGLGLISYVSLSSFFFSDSNKENKKKEEIDDFDKAPWNIVYGDEFSNSSYKAYDNKNYSKVSFNEINAEHNDMYEILIPTDAKIEKVKNYYINYKSADLNVSCKDDSIDNLDMLLEEIYEDYKNVNDKVSFFRKNYNDLVIIRVMAEKKGEANIYSDSLIIFKVKENKDFISYASVEYSLINKKFDDSVIKKLSKGFIVKEGQANYDFCNKDGEKYECNFEVSSLNKGTDKFKITIPKDKYYLSFDNSIGFFPIIVTTGFNDEDQYKEVDIQIIYLDLEQAITNLKGSKFSGSVKTSSVNINNKKFAKLYSDLNNVTYLYEIDDSKVLQFDVDTYEKDTDKLMEVFTNFEFN